MSKEGFPSKLGKIAYIPPEYFSDVFWEAIHEECREREAKLRAALKAAEWSRWTENPYKDTCIVCDGQIDYGGHKDDCIVAEALKDE